jgi:hypothetical protein
MDLCPGTYADKTRFAIKDNNLCGRCTDLIMLWEALSCILESHPKEMVTEQESSISCFSDPISSSGQRGFKANSQQRLEDNQRCEFCGRDMREMMRSHSSFGARKRKYCSSTCLIRAVQRKKKARLAEPPTKRQAARLRFSNPLYFNYLTTF